MGFLNPPETEATPTGHELRSERAELIPRRREWGWVLFVCATFLGFNLASYNYYPAVWFDEVSFSEPAVNLVKYGSFTTTVWQFQPLNTFPAVNCPLYSMALVPWLELTGTSVLGIRSLNFTLFEIAVLLVWVVAWAF